MSINRIPSIIGHQQSISSNQSGLVKISKIRKAFTAAPTTTTLRKTSSVIKHIGTTNITVFIANCEGWSLDIVSNKIMVLADLGAKLTNALRKISNTTVVDDKILNELLTDIASALLQSDVNIHYINTLRNSVKT